MKRLISFVLFANCTLHLFSQNLTVNPGFETWQKINKPTGWTTALSCLKDSVLIHSGNYSCRQATTADSKELGQLIPVTGGSQFRISFWYRNETAGAGNGCRIWSNWKDSEGNSLNDEASLSLLHSGYLKSDTWKQYTADVTAPLAAAYFNLIIRTLPNSVTYWDDIVFEESLPTYKSEMRFNDIMIYPNPATNYLNISNMQNIQLIEIQTVTGIVVWRSSFSGEEKIIIPVSRLENGIYIICMHSNGKRIIRKFIKN